eukprot:m.24866 g.24866  ORF g.24866 m.24866 type:complete len:413 (+) comp7652_c0_seq3:263-1501(+)
MSSMYAEESKALRIGSPHDSINLDNFEEASKQARGSQFVLTSPRSLRACHKHKIAPIDLLPRSYQDFESLARLQKASADAVRNEFSAYERRRKILLSIVREERNKLVKQSFPRTSSKRSIGERDLAVNNNDINFNVGHDRKEKEDAKMELFENSRELDDYRLAAMTESLRNLQTNLEESKNQWAKDFQAQRKKAYQTTIRNENLKNKRLADERTRSERMRRGHESRIQTAAERRRKIQREKAVSRHEWHRKERAKYSAARAKLSKREAAQLEYREYVRKDQEERLHHAMQIREANMSQHRILQHVQDEATARQNFDISLQKHKDIMRTMELAANIAAKDMHIQSLELQRAARENAAHQIAVGVSALKAKAADKQKGPMLLVQRDRESRQRAHLESQTSRGQVHPHQRSSVVL